MHVVQELSQQMLGLAPLRCLNPMQEVHEFIKLVETQLWQKNAGLHKVQKLE